jgi:hypothetical protein
MNVKKVLIGLVLSAAVCVAKDVSADTLSNGTGGGDWEDANTWEGGIAGDCNGCVVIQSGDTVVVTSDQCVAGLAVYGTLLIYSGATLTILGDCDSGVTLVDGLIQLGDIVGGTRGSLKFDANNRMDHTLQGSGSIQGVYAASKIQIANNVTLYSQITLEGVLKIQPVTGHATFVNQRLSPNVEGQILANSPGGTFEFATGLYLDDDMYNGSYRPLYQVSANGAVLKFNEPSDASPHHPRLVGDFSLSGSCGVLQITSNVSNAVETTGTVLTFSNAKITTNGVGAPYFRYDWVAGPSYTEVANCSANGTCNCP